MSDLQPTHIPVCFRTLDEIREALALQAAAHTIEQLTEPVRSQYEQWVTEQTLEA